VIAELLVGFFIAAARAASPCGGVCGRPWCDLAIAALQSLPADCFEPGVARAITMLHLIAAERRRRGGGLLN
jgi:hypothetical protein